MPESVTVEPDVEYANPDGQHLKLNLARPKEGDGPFPATLCIHGGGFRAGSRQGYDAQCIRLAEKGSDRILLVVTGEMGRTPRRNKDGGRDHYPNLTTLLLSGGSLKMGQIIGQSDRMAAQPSSERYTPKHLMATIMHTLLVLGEVRLRTGLGKVAKVVTDGEPIPALV